MNQSIDEEQIRQVISTWMDATAAGDVGKLLDLMTEDVVFLRPGREPMRGREAFAAGFRMALQHFRIAAESKIEEIHVFGSSASCWNHLTVTLIPRDGTGVPKKNEGAVLSVFRKCSDGKWRICRDANMLTEAKA